jgi:predicted DNA-binding protein (UPF0251 family)
VSARVLAEAALEIGRARAQLELRLRGALLRSDEAEALRLARVLVGLEEDDAAGDRAASREH